MRVTIGLPVYNGGDLIDRALTSLRLQSHTDLIVHVVDNGSSDHSVAVAEMHASADPRIHVHSMPHVSAPQNFARCLDLADSPAFMWAAHDDYWAQTVLQNATEAIAQGADYYMANWWTGVIDDGALGSSVVQRRHPLSFLRNSNRKSRTLNFVNQHHEAHKCNLVYAVFETGFIRRLTGLQDISNDGVLSTLVASEGKGVLDVQVQFFKDFHESTIPHSALRRRIRVLASRTRDGVSAEHRKMHEKFLSDKRETLAILIRLYPEYEEELRMIFRKYSRSALGPKILARQDW